jgi:osmotically-inducible protein OsmY
MHRLRAILAGVVAAAVFPVAAQPMIQLDPFAQATAGDGACRARSPQLLTEQEARAEWHVRVERGTRCAMEGTCEPGGAYRRDPEINEHVRALIAGDRRFSDTSVWVSTSRRWVTLQGCVRRAAQRRALVETVARVRDVERVFDELTLGSPLRKR